MSEFEAVLEGLTRVPGVRGAMIVDAPAGVPVAAVLETGVDGGALAALVSSLHARASRSVDRAGYGRLDALQLECAAGHVVTAAGTELAVVVLAAADAQLGLLRLRVRDAAREIAE